MSVYNGIRNTGILGLECSKAPLPRPLPVNRHRRKPSSQSIEPSGEGRGQTAEVRKLRCQRVATGRIAKEPGAGCDHRHRGARFAAEPCRETGAYFSPVWAKRTETHLTFPLWLAAGDDVGDERYCSVATNSERRKHLASVR